MQCQYSSYLALLAALEHRSHAASLLLGYSDAGYAARDMEREFQESAAVERASQVALAAIGEAEFARLRHEGGRLRDEQIAAFAFARSDA